jgi:hypothetical protein
LDINKKDKLNQWSFKGRKTLFDNNIDVRIVNGIHTKNIIIDDDLITFGSFNWLGATTNNKSSWARFETSVILTKEYASQSIAELLTKLNSLSFKTCEEFHDFIKIIDPYIINRCSKNGITMKDIEKEEEELKHHKKDDQQAQDVTSFAIKLYQQYRHDIFFKDICYHFLLNQVYLNKNSWKYIFPCLYQIGITKDQIQEEIFKICNIIDSVEDYLNLAEIFIKIDKDIAQKVTADLIKSYGTLMVSLVSYSPELTIKRLNEMGFNDFANEIKKAVEEGGYLFPYI